ncbi:MAG: photosystem II assembly protein Psb35 [Leptolyngbyaceae cyanobacterium]
MFGFQALIALEYATTLKTLVYVLFASGFLVAVVAGSVAWYNSKKPAGWEGAEKPDWVPKVGGEEGGSKDS